MSYTINVRVINDTEDSLVLVEKTIWYYANGGTWTEGEGGHLLSIGGSGTSGLLRFKSSAGEEFAVLVGVHNYKRWADIAVDLKQNDTATKIHPLYYSSDTKESATREKQLSETSNTTPKGKKLDVNFYKKDGNQLFATFTYN